MPSHETCFWRLAFEPLYPYTTSPIRARSGKMMIKRVTASLAIFIFCPRGTWPAIDPEASSATTTFRCSLSPPSNPTGFGHGVTSVVTSERHNLVRVSVQAPGSAAHNLPVLHLLLEAPFFWFLGLGVQFRSRSFLPSNALGQREQEKSKAYGQQGHQTKVAIHTHHYGPKVLEASL